MSAARAARRRQRAGVPAPHGGAGGGGDVGGAALGRAAPLDEAAASVRIVLRLQRGGGEDVGGQPPQLIGPRRVPFLIQLQTDQSERGREVSTRRPTLKVNISMYLNVSCFPTTNVLPTL